MSVTNVPRGLCTAVEATRHAARVTSSATRDDECISFM